MCGCKQYSLIERRIDAWSCTPEHSIKNCFYSKRKRKMIQFNFNHIDRHKKNKILRQFIMLLMSSHVHRLLHSGSNEQRRRRRRRPNSTIPSFLIIFIRIQYRIMGLSRIEYGRCQSTVLYCLSIGGCRSVALSVRTRMGHLLNGLLYHRHTSSVQPLKKQRRHKWNKERKYCTEFYIGEKWMFSKTVMSHGEWKTFWHRLHSYKRFVPRWRRPLSCGIH